MSDIDLVAMLVGENLRLKEEIVKLEEQVIRLTQCLTNTIDRLTAPKSIQPPASYEPGPQC